MNKKLCLSAISLALIVSACGSEHEAKKAVLADLKDPDSAKFGEFTQVGERACLSVNAKNGHGGYTGETAFIVLHQDGKWISDGDTDRDQQECVERLNREESAREGRERKSMTTTIPDRLDVENATDAQKQCTDRFNTDRPAKGVAAYSALKKCLLPLGVVLN